MMKNKIIPLLISVAALSELSACSYVKSLFPDKEKDYQYTTEIPPLILPADLNNTRIPGAHPTASARSVGADAAVLPAAVNAPEKDLTAASTLDKPAVPVEKASPATTSPGSEAEVPDTAIIVERVKLDGSNNLLRMNVDFGRAWRTVSKALSRKAIEVTERNQETRIITVQYDPDEQKAEDGSYWDEMVFLFKGIQSNEKPYLLKFEENNQQTDIIVVDEDQKPLSDEASSKLLTLVEETIKADLAAKKPD
jgi:outer membrane protein assembly factor BamC